MNKSHAWQGLNTPLYVVKMSYVFLRVHDFCLYILHKILIYITKTTGVFMTHLSINYICK